MTPKPAKQSIRNAHTCSHLFRTRIKVNAEKQFTVDYSQATQKTLFWIWSKKTDYKTPRTLPRLYQINNVVSHQLPNGERIKGTRWQDFYIICFLLHLCRSPHRHWKLSCHQNRQHVFCACMSSKPLCITMNSVYKPTNAYITAENLHDNKPLNALDIWDLKLGSSKSM